MAISTTYKQVEQEYNSEYWKSFEELEQYYLQRIQETLPDRNFYIGKDGIEIQIASINHFPELKEYEVWSAGYHSTGCHSGATLLGRAFARNFRQACDIVMCKRHLEYIDKNNTQGSVQCSTYAGWSYEPNTLTNWGSNLYWSEELASKYF